MAAKTLGRAPSKHYPNASHPNEPDPDGVADVYASICKGDCLSPMFEDGACLVFSKVHAIRPGDFVGFWLHPDAVAPGELVRRVKRLISGLPEGMALPYQPNAGDEVEPIFILEQLNPFKRYYVRASKILAMHRLVGEAEEDGTGRARITRQMIGGRMMRLYEEEGA
ncbi:MAG TPA: hypothetical protein VM711_07350 [Sphingomicrobium sp.]|nr:hypothetical protein [Sphingomicrobium sp.]